ncbi:MAG: class I SAM-dependent methyltransferase [Vulcanimicrobiota bacterium]
MSIHRIDSFFDELETPPEKAKRILEMAMIYAERSQGMMHLEDLKALGAALVHLQPEKLFEIGTFRGNSADFCLTLLPNLQVVSIAYVAPLFGILGPKYNNYHKRKGEIGSTVRAENQSRFKQLYGDSHKLSAVDLLSDFGYFDFVLIDGDHSALGVAQDTTLASQILNPQRGAVCWHDANPLKKFESVRIFLEQHLPVQAVATRDNFIGGIAHWEGLPAELSCVN